VSIDQKDVEQLLDRVPGYVTEQQGLLRNGAASRPTRQCPSPLAAVAALSRDGP
jgi:hypothetical protein